MLVEWPPKRCGIGAYQKMRKPISTDKVEK